MAESILLYVAMFIAGVLPGGRPLLTDAVVAQLALQVLRSGDAAEAIERAAFIIKKPSGGITLLPWPGRGTYSASWKGPVPNGVIAVIHTHPSDRPVPSAQDRAEAKRLGVPFYVVSRAGLCVADAANRVYCAGRIPWLMRGRAIGETVLEWTMRATGTS